MKQPKRLLSTTLMILGFVFLADPTVNILGLLPDSLGYLFLILALAPLVQTVPHFEEAQTGFRKMLYVSLLKIPVGLYVLSLLAASPRDLPVFAVLALGFGILEFLFLLPALRNLFDGFFALATRFDVNEADELPRGTLGGLRLITVLFFAVRILAGALPSFTLLGGDDGLGGLAIDTSRFAPLTAIGVLVSLAFAILWLSRMIPYLRAVCPLCDQSEAIRLRQIELIPTARAMEKRKKVHLITLFLMLAAFTSVDLWFDDVNFLPDFLTGVLLLLLARYAWKEGFVSRKLATFSMAASTLYSVASLGGYVTGLVFALNYRFTDVGRKKLADLFYRIWTVFSSVEGVLGVVMRALLAPLLFSVVRAVTGRYHVDGTLVEDDLTSYRRRIGCVTAAGILTLAFEPLELFLRSITTIVPSDPGFTDGTMRIKPYGGLWILSLALSLLFFLLSLALSSALREGCKSRFPT